MTEKMTTVEMMDHREINHEGLYTWALTDARGIYCAKVCEKCEDTVKAEYRPEIFEDGNYECDEQIEPED